MKFEHRWNISVIKRGREIINNEAFKTGIFPFENYNIFERIEIFGL